MRILLNPKDHPLRAQSAYATIANYMSQYLIRNHDLAIFAPVGTIFSRDYIVDRVVREGTMQDYTTPVLPGLQFDYGEDMVYQHYEDFKADIMLQIVDVHALDPNKTAKLARSGRITWILVPPVDFPPPFPDRIVESLGSAYRIVPWCFNAFNSLKAAGLKNVMEPVGVGINEKIWVQLDRTKFPETMKAMGFDPEGKSFNILCFPKSTPIISADFSPRPIESLNSGDELLSQHSMTQVQMPMQRNYNGVLISLKPLGLPVVKMTPEHPVLAVKRKNVLCAFPAHKKKGLVSFPKRNVFCPPSSEDSWIPEWIPAGELERGDFVVTPVPEDSKDIQELDLRTCLPSGARYRRIGRFMKTWHGEKWVNGRIVVTDDFLRLLGYYAAEGNVEYNWYKGTRNVSGISFSFHEKEELYHQDVRRAMNELFGLDGHIFRNGSHASHGIKIKFYSPFAGHLFKTLCGEYASHKRFDPRIMQLPPKRQAYVLEGLFRGDGWSGNFVRRSSRLQVLATTSNCLAWQAFFMILRNGKMPWLNEQQPAEHDGHSRVFSVGVPEEGQEHVTKRLRLGHYLYSPLHSVEREKFVGVVYNMKNTSEAPTYVAGGITVHNCTNANQVGRKCWSQNVQAIAMFHKKYPEANTRVYVHAPPAMGEGWNLPELLKFWGIADIARGADPYQLMNGLYGEEEMVKIHNMADVCLNTGSEGWGMATIESQIVGVPVIGLDFGPTPELLRYGALVPVRHLEQMPSMLFNATPDAADILEALEMIYLNRQSGKFDDQKADTIRWIRENFSWDVIMEKWKTTLESIESDLRHECRLRSQFPPEPSDWLAQRSKKMVRLGEEK